MALGEQEAVALRPVGMLRVDAQLVEAQGRQGLRRRVGPPRWPLWARQTTDALTTRTGQEGPLSLASVSGLDAGRRVDEAPDPRDTCILSGEPIRAKSHVVPMPKCLDTMMRHCSLGSLARTLFH